jgi:hypothetical protein
MTRRAARNWQLRLEPGMSSFLVMFDEWRATAGRGRSAAVASARAITAENRDRLLAFVAEHGLSDQVARVDHPTAFGAVGLIATPEAAALIKKMDGVSDVLRAG